MNCSRALEPRSAAESWREKLPHLLRSAVRDRPGPQRYAPTPRTFITKHEDHIVAPACFSTSSVFFVLQTCITFVRVLNHTTTSANQGVLKTSAWMTRTCLTASWWGARITPCVETMGDTTCIILHNCIVILNVILILLITVHLYIVCLFNVFNLCISQCFFFFYCLLFVYIARTLLILILTLYLEFPQRAL